MLRTALCCTALLFAMTSTVWADEQADKLLSGMSIVGNDEAPKSLVIIPWKSSELAGTLDISRILSDDREPVDRDVFARELNYYEIRAASPLRHEPVSQ